MIAYKSVSLANQVFEQLEHSILTGEYKQGEVISEKRLSEELGVSRTPIREAISMLEAEDLIEDSPQGTVVRGITEKDVRDSYEVKRRVEVLASRWAANNITDEQLKELHEIVEKQEFYAQKNETEKLRDLDTDFHDVIYEASGSTVLKRILKPLHHKMYRYRKASLEIEDRIDDSVNEHRRIYEALAEHDEDQVESLMQIHIDKAFRQMIRIMEGK
ncbi:MAG: GntR family transcriptional regulator [Anaerovoracaceae bacterium]|jgi:DNA-binding GntR family transcriptional regulator